jgi:hypothetical protein
MDGSKWNRRIDTFGDPLGQPEGSKIFIWGLEVHLRPNEENEVGGGVGR